MGGGMRRALSSAFSKGMLVMSLVLFVTSSAFAEEVADLEGKLHSLKSEYKEISRDYQERIRQIEGEIKTSRGQNWFQERWDRVVNVPGAQEIPEGRSDVTAVWRRDEIKTRNNDADNTWGITARLEKPIWREWSVAGEANYLHSQKWPYIKDPKGFFGDTRGYGGMASLVFRPEVLKWASPYVIGGVGYYAWHFHENPYLQDNEITVDLDPSVAMRIGVGFDLWATDQWGVNFEVSYFDTNIPKLALNAQGVEQNILGDDYLGHEQIQISVGSRYRF